MPTTTEAQILNLTTHESAPQLSPYDPYCATAFGRINCIFSLNEKKYYFYAATADRSPDNFLLMHLPTWYPIDCFPGIYHPKYIKIPRDDSSFNPFVANLFNASVGDKIELPELLANHCKAMHGE